MMKPWECMTEKEITAIKKEKCQFCRYAANLCGRSADNLNSVFCDYLGKAGMRRGCRPDQCDKFERKGRKRQQKAKTVKRRRKKE